CGRGCGGSSSPALLGALHFFNRVMLVDSRWKASCARAAPELQERRDGAHEFGIPRIAPARSAHFLDTAEFAHRHQSSSSPKRCFNISASALSRKRTVSRFIRYSMRGVTAVTVT